MCFHEKPICVSRGRTYLSLSEKHNHAFRGRKSVFFVEAYFFFCEAHSRKQIYGSTRSKYVLLMEAQFFPYSGSTKKIYTKKSMIFSSKTEQKPKSRKNRKTLSKTREREKKIEKKGIQTKRPARDVWRLLGTSFSMVSGHQNSPVEVPSRGKLVSFFLPNLTNP